MYIDLFEPLIVIGVIFIIYSLFVLFKINFDFSSSIISTFFELIFCLYKSYNSYEKLSIFSLVSSSLYVRIFIISFILLIELLVLFVLFE